MSLSQMKYLLDTCVISELVKKEPHPAMIRWMDAGDESRMYLSVLKRNGRERDGGSKR